MITKARKSAGESCVDLALAVVDDIAERGDETPTLSAWLDAHGAEARGANLRKRLRTMEPAAVVDLTRRLMHYARTAEDAADARGDASLDELRDTATRLVAGRFLTVDAVREVFRWQSLCQGGTAADVLSGRRALAVRELEMLADLSTGSELAEILS